MSFERPDAGKSLASYQRKTKQGKQSSPFSKKTNDQYATPAGTEDSNDVFDNLPTMETEDGAKAALRRQELTAVKTDDEEVRRNKEMQTTKRPKAEAQHDEDLHKLRVRRMRERKAAGKIGTRAVQTLETAHEAAFEIEWESDQAGGVRRRRKIRNSMPEQAEPLLPHPLTSNCGHGTSHASADRYNIAWSSRYDTMPFDARRPSLKWTDPESFTVPGQGSSPPPNTHWRDPQRQRGQLNLDFSRIDTQFILSLEFIDDVNTMLDFINGWPEYQIECLKYAFQKDSVNRGRTVEFIDMGNKRWGVQLLNPLRRDSEISCPLTCSNNYENLPDACRKFGCDQGCPRTVSMKQRIADLKDFREQQSLPPPPIPPRSSKRKTPFELPGPASPLLPRFKPAPLAAVSEPPSSPRLGFRTLPDSDVTTERIEDVDRSKSDLQKQVNQTKTSMTRFKDRFRGKRGPQATEREMVKAWLHKFDTVSGPLKGGTLVLEDAPMSEAGATLQQINESNPSFAEPIVERSTTPSDSPPSPPSPRLRQLYDDIPVYDPEERPPSPQAPHNGDGMELDDDMPVWDQEKEREKTTRHKAPEESTLEGRRANQEHGKRLMHEGSLQKRSRTLRAHRTDRSQRQETPGSVPAKSSVLRNPNGSTRMFMIPMILPAHQRPRHPGGPGRVVYLGGRSGAEKKMGDDKELLEELFKEK